MLPVFSYKGYLAFTMGTFSETAETLPFFNFSLKKVLALEPDSFKRAKIQIILTVIVFSLIKAVLVMPVAIEYAQYRQFFRALVIIVLFFLRLMILR